MFSLLVWPILITLSGFHCTKVMLFENILISIKHQIKLHNKVRLYISGIISKMTIIRESKQIQQIINNLLFAYGLKIISMYPLSKYFIESHLPKIDFVLFEIRKLKIFIYIYWGKTGISYESISKTGISRPRQFRKN